MSNTMYSPYQCAKVVNDQLHTMGIEKKLPPQMFYTYTSKGFIPSHKDENNKVRVNHEDLVQWFTKYVNKNHKGSNDTETNNIDTNQLTLDI